MEVARPITAKRGTAVFVAPPDMATVWQVSLQFTVAESARSSTNSREMKEPGLTINQYRSFDEVAIQQIGTLGALYKEY
jgi:hypothetical protein